MNNKKKDNKNDSNNQDVTTADLLYVKLRKYLDNELNIAFLIRIILITIFIIVAYTCNTDLQKMCGGEKFIPFLFSWIFGIGTFMYVIFKMLLQTNKNLYETEVKENSKNKDKAYALYKINCVLMWILAVPIELLLMKELIRTFYNLQPFNIIFVLSLLAFIADVIVVWVEDTKYDSEIINKNIFLGIFGFAVMYTLFLSFTPRVEVDYNFGGASGSYPIDYKPKYSYTQHDILYKFIDLNVMFNFVAMFLLGFKLLKARWSLIVSMKIFKRIALIIFTAIELMIFLYFFTVYCIIIIQSPLAVISIFITFLILCLTYVFYKENRTREVIISSSIAILLVTSILIVSGCRFVKIDVDSYNERYLHRVDTYTYIEYDNIEHKNTELKNTKPKKNEIDKINNQTVNKLDKTKEKDSKHSGEKIKAIVTSNVTSATAFLIGVVYLGMYIRSTNINKINLPKEVREDMEKKEKMMLIISIGSFAILLVLEGIKTVVIR